MCRNFQWVSFAKHVRFEKWFFSFVLEESQFHGVCLELLGFCVHWKQIQCCEASCGTMQSVSDLQVNQYKWSNIFIGLQLVELGDHT